VAYFFGLPYSTIVTNFLVILSVKKVKFENLSIRLIYKAYNMFKFLGHPVGSIYTYKVDQRCQSLILNYQQIALNSI